MIMAIPDVPKPELLRRLRDEVGVPAGEDERLENVLDYARGYVVPAIGDAEVGMNVYIDCVVACAADLYGVPAGEDERLENVLDYARGYVVPAIGDAEVGMNVYIDCVVACAADLYNSRNARFGVLNAGTDGLDAVRISNDPLYSVWPKLRAAGVLTGRQVIA